MSGLEQKLRVQVVYDEIIVTLPGFSYSVTYYKPDNSPQLSAGRFCPLGPLGIWVVRAFSGVVFLFPRKVLKCWLILPITVVLLRNIKGRRGAIDHPSVIG